MLRLRKTGGAAGQLALIGLVATMPRDHFVQPDLAQALYPLAIVLGFGVVGVIRGRLWGRWLALSAAVAVLPWAAVFVLASPVGYPPVRAWVTLGAVALLVASLTGRGAFAAFEGRVADAPWTGRRMSVVRWAVITNLAAAANLYVFAVAYRPAAAWHAAIPGALALALVCGAWLVARRRTLGLLVLAMGCVFQPPAIAFFLARQPVTSEERLLLIALLLPAWLIATATLVAFAGPMWRFGRE